MLKPAHHILTWIDALDPADELAARMALWRINEWCQQDPQWLLCIEKLRGDLIKTEADRDHFARESHKIADDIENADKLKDAPPVAHPLEG
jgi:hypothetical protein